MFPKSRQIQQFLTVTTRNVLADPDDDFLAPTPYIAPPWWRKSDNEEAGIEQGHGMEVGGWDLEVVGVKGGDTMGRVQRTDWSSNQCTRGEEKLVDWSRGEGRVESWRVSGGDMRGGRAQGTD